MILIIINTSLSPDKGTDDTRAHDEEPPDPGELELIQPLLLDSKLQTLGTLDNISQIPNLHLSDDVPSGTEDSRLHYLGAPGEPGAGAEP